MPNENNQPKRRQHGPGMGPAPAKKAKNFKSAISRLFKELKSFHALILVALILAALSSVLSIISPNKLSDLTDEISKGLVIKTDVMKEITEKVTASVSEKNLQAILPQILQMNLSEETSREILTSPSIKDESKIAFQNSMAKIGTMTNQQDVMKELSNLPEDVLTCILKTSTYQGIEITSPEKVTFLKSVTQMMDKENKTSTSLEIPESIQKVFFQDFKIKSTTITSSDQAKFLTIMSGVGDKTNTKELYTKLDKLPKNIKKVIEPTMNMTKIKNIALFLVIVYLLSALFSYIESISMTIVANKFAKKLRSNISTKINKLPLKFFDAHQSGDILSRVTNDVDTIAQSMNQSLSTLVSAITLFIGTIIMMFVTNWIMAITAIVSSLLGFVFMFLILGKSQKYLPQDK